MVFMLTPFAGVSADPAVTSGDGRPVNPEQQAQSASPSSGEETQAPDRVETPTKPFIPSESISADSAISFPVDI
jgi:hypothetical protein